MAKVLDQMPASTRLRNGSKYDRFLDGQVWMLERGSDYARTSKPTSVGFAIRLVAKKRGLRVHIRIDVEHIYVQAFTPEEKRNGDTQEG